MHLRDLHTHFHPKLYERNVVELVVVVAQIWDEFVAVVIGETHDLTHHPLMR
jgi:hypothetical protein